MNKLVPFITVEGGEGSGKSTILKKVFEKLKNNNIDVILSREPGGVEISEQIRNVIVDVKNNAMDKRTEALLYAASRRQHLIEKVIPSLNSGKIVLLDRFIDSSLAYQGYARKIGIEEILKINQFAIDGYMPDLTIFFDLDPKIGLERINKNSKREINRFDLERMEFHKKVREGYYLLLEKYPERIVKIDASKSIEEVTNDVYSLIEDKLKEFGIK